MNVILSKIHFLVILYAGFGIFTEWEAHKEKLDNEKGTLDSIRTRITKKTREFNQIKKYKKSIDETKKRIELVAQEVEKIQKKLPNEIDNASILDSLKNFADKLKIKNVYLAPGSENPHGFYVSRRFEFKATGTYQQFLNFFKEISESERILNVKKLTFEKVNKSQRGRYHVINCTASIEAYKYNAKHKEGRGFNEIEEKFKKTKKRRRRKPRKS